MTTNFSQIPQHKINKNQRHLPSTEAVCLSNITMVQIFSNLLQIVTLVSVLRSLPVESYTCHTAPAFVQTRVSYDLGIGKHQPLQRQQPSIPPLPEPSTKTAASVVGFLNEHDGIIANFPSPSSPLKARPVLRRHASDILVIQQNALYNVNGVYPVASVADGSQARGLELNTPWLELLIHEQQIKLAA
jgi:hypothetical protein